MLADERAIRRILERHGPERAGTAWARLTAAVIRDNWHAALPNSFPALLVDAERMAANAGLGTSVALRMYRRANAAWRRLEKGFERQLLEPCSVAPEGPENSGNATAGCSSDPAAQR